MGWLMRGSQGDNVEAIQGLLWQAGLYDGAIDGWFGRKTDEALRDWQREVGVLADGKWGPKTIDASARRLAVLNSEDGLNQGNPAIVPHVPRTIGRTS